jgi:XTP/dITP diphosphohydrolase
MRLTGTLVLASHNAGKLREIAALVEPHGLHVRPVSDWSAQVPEETGATFAENALIKARHAAHVSGLPALADDSGLAVHALGGQPGIHTADWAETPTGRDWNLAMRKVEDALQAQGPGAPRTCTFHCVLAVAWPDGHEQTFEGTIDGTLAWPPRGQVGFGYDPVFVPHGDTRTFAELDPAEKHAISHRAAAFAKLRATLLPSPPA